MVREYVTNKETFKQRHDEAESRRNTSVLVLRTETSGLGHNDEGRMRPGKQEGPGHVRPYRLLEGLSSPLNRNTWIL